MFNDFAIITLALNSGIWGKCNMFKFKKILKNSCKKGKLILSIGVVLGHKLCSLLITCEIKSNMNF
ncbi:hypothetical protein NQ317_017467 [Molorchus minor]|uniref:Uncharacterized protein n=1 Tax=Molorchus minor TaxID=1323400 RepID=A0ABQ9J0P5_9CUCU|nr:hypothetical protein NQ317_017467 [Molorchus minor]